jgi:hypothetical protein
VEFRGCLNWIFGQWSEVWSSWRICPSLICAHLIIPYCRFDVGGTRSNFQPMSNQNLTGFHDFLSNYVTEGFRCHKVEIPNFEIIYAHNDRLILYKDWSDAKILSIFNQFTRDIQKIPLMHVTDLLSFVISQSDQLMYFTNTIMNDPVCCVIHDLQTLKEVKINYTIGGYPRSLCLDHIIFADFLENDELIFVQENGILIIDSKVQTTRRVVSNCKQVQMCTRYGNKLLLGPMDCQGEVFTFDIATMSILARFKHGISYTDCALGEKYIYMLMCNREVRIFDAKSLARVGTRELVMTDQIMFVNGYLFATTSELDRRDKFGLSFSVMSEGGDLLSQYKISSQKMEKNGKFWADFRDGRMILRDLEVHGLGRHLYLFDQFRYVKTGALIWKCRNWDTVFLFH